MMTKNEVIKSLKLIKSTVYLGNRKFLDALDRAIELLKQSEQRWIPVSERLPEPMGWDKNYLVSLAWGGVGAMEYKSTGFHNYGSFSPVPIETVTAWMPLPEPYREEGEE